MQLVCRLVPTPTLTAHPKKKMSWFIVKHGLDVNMSIWQVPWVCHSVSPPLKNPSYASVPELEYDSYEFG